MRFDCPQMEQARSMYRPSPRANDGNLRFIADTPASYGTRSVPATIPIMPLEIATLLGHVSSGGNFSFDETAAAIDAIMRGLWSDDQIALLLTAMAAKGETVDEIAGAAQAMRRHMTPIRSHHADVLDTCGTGGGGSALFNVSTTAAIVAAAAGMPVAKHGNRSITSRSGSADVLTELGVNISASTAQVEACLNELGLCFCFAPLAHPAMQHVAVVRRKLGIRTIFNILGPLVNPAGARFQLLGAGRPELRPLLAGAIERLGTNRTFVVCGEDGLGDVTLAGATHVTQVSNPPSPLQGEAGGGEFLGGALQQFSWHPEDFGIPRQSLTGLAIDSPTASAALIRKVLSGSSGPPRDIVILNAAAALLAAGRAQDPTSAAATAASAIDSRAAENLLARLAARSHQPA